VWFCEKQRCLKVFRHTIPKWRYLPQNPLFLFVAHAHSDYEPFFGGENNTHKLHICEQRNLEFLERKKGERKT